jgi:DNA repair protein RadD
MITLRPYQDQCIAGLRGAFAQGYHSPLLVSPTGSGKTVMFSYLTGKLLAAGKRVALLCHREELVDQISRTLRDFDVRHGLITAGSLYDRRLQAHVASVATLIRRLDRTAVPDYVICDEAHHCIGASTWGKIVAGWRKVNPALRLIGVTATPERLSGEGLGEVFDEMVLGPTTRELIDIGSLAEYRLFAPHQAVDLSGVHMQAGDFNRKELGGALDKPAIIGSAVGEYSKLLNGAPAVAFCVSVEHAHHVAEQFRAAGFRSACIDGKMDKGLRRDLVRDFANGQVNVLTSCDIVSEGFDIPGIVGAILLRPTWSLALYLQQVGRALRTAPGKDSAVLLDHVGNSSRHGMVDDPRAWSLLGREERRGKKKDEDVVACRQCEKCYAVSPAAASKCRECGAPFPVKSRQIEEVAGTLSEVEVAKARREAARTQAAAQTLEDLIRLGTQRGMANPTGWARHVHAARVAKGRA